MAEVVFRAERSRPRVFPAARPSRILGRHRAPGFHRRHARNRARLDGMPRPDHRDRSGRTARTGYQRRAHRTRHAGIAGPGLPRTLPKPVHARDRMVQPAHSGAYSPPDARAFAPRNRAGHRCAISSVPAALAARLTQHSASRRGWRIANRAPIAGLRDSGVGVGRERVEAAHRRIRPGESGRSLPLRRSSLGAPVAASGIAGCRAPRPAHTHRADFVLRPRGCRLVDRSRLRPG